MGLKPRQHERVIYDKNPLIEVVGQVRFPRSLEIDAALPIELQKKIAHEYPKLEIQPAFELNAGQLPMQQLEPVTAVTYQFVSEDDVYRLSLNNSFVAVTCKKYSKWEEFSDRFFEAVSLVADIYGIKHRQRLGLRYQDLINRDSLGLQEASWSSLIAPFLLGPLSAGTISDDQNADGDIGLIRGEYGISLERCELILRHGLVQINNAPIAAYLIDADYWEDDKKLTGYDLNDIKSRFNEFHTYSGSVFRSCISESLHNALGPKPIGSSS